MKIASSQIDVCAHHLVVWFLFLVITCGYAAMAIYAPYAYIWLTYEDLYGEWAQTYFFLAAFVFSALRARSCANYRFFFVMLAISTLYVFLEEISWGQRIFNFSSPDFFREHNLQSETNIHNMLVDPFGTDLKRAIEYLVAVVLIGYGLVYPLCKHVLPKICKMIEKIGIAPPPLYLWPFFVSAAILETGPFHFNEAEVAELLVGTALAILAFQYWYASHLLIDDQWSMWNAKISKRFSMLVSIMIVCVIVLAGSTTNAAYATPSWRKDIDNRLLNGYEKFASRYKRYDRWDVTARLYRRVHLAEPKRTTILRKLAYAEKKIGNKDKFDEHLALALNIALSRYKKHPDKVSHRVTVSNIYRDMGDKPRQKKYAALAINLAKQFSLDHPDDANHAYWLGRSCYANGDRDCAIEQYEKAHRLKPSLSKYRKAYLNMKY